MAARKKTAKGTRDARRRGEQRTGAEAHCGSAAPHPRRGTAYVSTRDRGIVSMQYVVVDDDAVVEGDVVLGTVEQVERQSAVLKGVMRGELQSGVAITGEELRWRNCEIPYDINPDLPNTQRVTDAIQHWQDNTNFRFVLRTEANAASYPDWVTFRPSTGCSSAVGRRGGQQFVNLANGCTTGNTIHEIGHVVGLWHEQSREDRDAFVTIQFENIIPGLEGNFTQHIADGDDIGAYDYGSIMHYPRDAFSVNGEDTVTPVDPTAVIGQRVALSAGDIAAANSLCTPVVTLKERIPETLKETIPETLKEQAPETLKERIVETAKERIPETLKEQAPETLKERIPETAKERIPETLKEQAPETLKERVPETLKEQVPETLKERAPEPPVTFVEQVRPGGLGGIVPSVGVGGALPFAVRVPSRGSQLDGGGQLDPSQQPLLGSHDAAALSARLEELAQLIEHIQLEVQQLTEEYEATAQALAALSRS